MGRLDITQRTSKVEPTLAENRHEYVNPKSFDKQYIRFRNAGVSEANRRNDVTIEPKKRKLATDIVDDIDGYMGPWAGYDEKSPVAAPSRPESTKDDGASKIKVKEAPVTTFFGAAESDYQGRPWCQPPTNIRLREDPLEMDCYVPKKPHHSYVGHSMGVNNIRFFPKYGHLLLSSSMDGNIRMWDVYNQKRCLRMYSGHKQACRQVNFTADGNKFYSCGYDNKVLLWDTEKGKILQTMENGHIPYCVTVNPEDENCVLVGCSNNKAVQYDGRSGDVVQQYSEHLASVNSVTFCDNNRKMMTSSDDKKIFVWEFGIPVVVKHIADTSMHSAPAACLHPEGKFLSFQSMDNQIVSYEGQGRFRFTPKKRFRGHMSSGYAIEPSFSPNGKYLLSGDQTGKLFVWDWNKNKIVKTMQTHDTVTMSAQWSPTEANLVATCGWDGLIKLWK